MFLFATPLVRIFTDDPEVIKHGGAYVRIATAVQWAYVMGFIYLGFFQAVKRPLYGLIESIVRKIGLPTIIFYFLIRVWEVDLQTFWWNSVIINISVTLITISYGRHVLKKVTLG